MSVRVFERCAMVVFAVAAVIQTPASAQLAVDRLWVDFEPGSPSRADVVIRNESSDRYYITISPSEIFDPGTDQERRVESSNPDELGLLVTPNRLIIDPGGIRSIRIVPLDPDPAKDRIYRVKVTPQVGDIEAPDLEGDRRGMAIKILAAYDLLVTVRPQDGRANLVANRSGTNLTIRNDGNTNALLYEGRDCPREDPNSSDEEKCVEVGSRRIYPGNSWTIALKSADDRVRFKQRLSASTDPKDIIY